MTSRLDVDDLGECEWLLVGELLFVVVADMSPPPEEALEETDLRESMRFQMAILEIWRPDVVKK